MLYAQITPAAEKTTQVTPFSAITESADLMFAVARPYTLGATRVNFQVTFGNGTIANNQVSNFVELLSSNVTLTSGELSNWGTDDSVVLSTIAAKLGTTSIGIYTSSPQQGNNF
jgi:hypothetical protein